MTPRPGPIFERQASDAEKFVAVSKPSSEISSVQLRMMNMYRTN